MEKHIRETPGQTAFLEKLSTGLWAHDKALRARLSCREYLELGGPQLAGVARRPIVGDALVGPGHDGVRLGERVAAAPLHVEDVTHLQGVDLVERVLGARPHAQNQLGLHALEGVPN